MSRPGVTPAAVREVALRLFAEKGYHGTALSEVASALGIRTPSLYNHIDSKQELLAEVLATTSRGVLDDFEEVTRVEAPVAARLAAAVRVYARRHATNRNEALVVNADFSALEEPVRSEVLKLRRRHEEGIRKLIVEGVREGVFETAQPFVASFGVLEMCVGIARWFSDGGALSPDHIADIHAELALRMVGLDDALIAELTTSEAERA